MITQQQPMRYNLRFSNRSKSDRGAAIYLPGIVFLLIGWAALSQPQGKLIFYFCVACAIVLTAVMLRISVPWRLLLNTSERVYRLEQGYRLRRSAIEGTFDDIKTIGLEERGLGLYSIMLHWNIERKPLAIENHTSLDKARVRQSALSEKLALPQGPEEA